MAAGEMHENIFEAGLPRGQVNELRTPGLHSRQQCGNGVVGFIDP
jgi:hypothetical protein